MVTERFEATAIYHISEPMEDCKRQYGPFIILNVGHNVQQEAFIVGRHHPCSWLRMDVPCQGDDDVGGKWVSTLLYRYGAAGWYPRGTGNAYEGRSPILSLFGTIPRHFGWGEQWFAVKS